MDRSAQVGKRVRELRKQRQLSQVALCDRLEQLGHPLDRTVLVKLEAGGRGVTVDDLVALAAALNVSPGWLLLPATAGDDEVPLVGSVTAPAWAAWQWIDGLHPLPTSDEDEGYNTPTEQDDFERGRPTELRQREQHPAVRAVRHLGFAVRRVLTAEDDDTRPRRMSAARDAVARVTAELDAIEAGEDERRI